MEAGTTVAERFDILSVLGAGGMGTVYRATDRTTGATVALKVLSGQSSDDAARFSREAAILAGLEHPTIVRYVAHGTTTDGQLYLVMDWVDGESLHARLRREPLDAPDAITIAKRAAVALATAHARGIVHRDVKPANIVLEGSDPGRAKLLDFGIARADDKGTLTTTGVAVGTPQYMAPEQARGDRTLDARADIYSLGCVLFEMLTGVPPFEGESSIAVLAKILLEEPPRPSEIVPGLPEALDDLVLRMLAKDRAARPSTALDLLAELEALDTLEATPSLRPPPAPPALTGREQRLLVVLMTEGVGERGASAPTLRPEEGAEVEGEVRDIVRAHGGTIEILPDGAFVATLGGRGTPTDHAARGARCALELARVLDDVQMALVAGRGVITERLPIGDVIDRGAEVLAEVRAEMDGGARIRLDRVMAGLLDGSFEVAGDRRGLYLRGLANERSTLRTVLGREVPLVGRKRELAVLDATLDECIDEPVSRLVLVTSPPGGGKSRLLREWRESVERRDEPMAILVGRGDPMRAGAPFAPLAQALRETAGIREGEPLLTRQEKLEARVARHVAPTEVARITAFLAEMARAPYPDETSEALRAARRDPQLMGDAIRAAFADFLDAEVRAHPVVLVLDDLHLGDAPTASLVETLSRRLEDRPFMVVAAARPEVHEHLPRLFVERDVVTIRLAKLTPRAAEELARTALGDGADAEDVARLVERADGNPFFLEELLRSRALGPDVRLPESIAGIVEARLDATSDELRRVLRAASIFGEVFWFGGLARLLGGERVERDLTEHLIAAESHELVARKRTSSVADETEWTFRHGILREAAYAMLTDHDQKLGHRLAAEWLEEVGGADPLALAEHCVKGERLERAAWWYCVAADQALEGHDLDAAVRRVEAGLGAAPDPETRGHLQLALAEARRWQGRYADAETAACEAVRALVPGTSRFFQAIGNAVVAAGHGGDTAAVDAHVALARATKAERAAKTERLVCLCRAATQAQARGDHDAADLLVAEVVDEAGSALVREPVVSAWVAALRAVRAFHHEDLEGYLDETERAIAAYVEAGDARHAENQRVRLGYGRMMVGEHEVAEAVLWHAQAGAERMGLAVIEAYATQNLGRALTLEGRLDEGETLLLRAAYRGDALGDAALTGGSLVYLTESALARVDVDEAARRADEACARLEEIPPLLTVALAARARVRLARGEADAALADARAALARIDTLAGVREARPGIQATFVEAALAAGARDEAARLLAEAEAELAARAERLRDPTRRARFLTEVPDHARLGQLARRLAEVSAG